MLWPKRKTNEKPLAFIFAYRRESLNYFRVWSLEMSLWPFFWCAQFMHCLQNSVLLANFHTASQQPAVSRDDHSAAATRSRSKSRSANSFSSARSCQLQSWKQKPQQQQKLSQIANIDDDDAEKQLKVASSLWHAPTHAAATFLARPSPLYTTLSLYSATLPLPLADCERVLLNCRLNFCVCYEFLAKLGSATVLIPCFK